MPNSLRVRGKFWIPDSGLVFLSMLTLIVWCPPALSVKTLDLPPAMFGLFVLQLQSLWLFVVCGMRVNPLFVVSVGVL